MEIERDDFTLCSAMMVELCTRKRDGGWWWEWYGGYKRIWEIRGMTCPIGFRRPCIAFLTCRIGSRTCHIGNGKLTHTQNSHKSQFLIMISPMSSYLSLSRPQLYHHLRTWCSVIPLYLSMPWSRVNTKYSIHQVQHTPSTAYTEYYIHRVLHHPKINSLLLPVSLSSPISYLSVDLIVLSSLHSHNYELTNEYSRSSRGACNPIYHLQIDHLQVLC